MRNSRSALIDQRGGAIDENFFNPQSPKQGATQGRTMTVWETLGAAASRAQGYNTIQSSALTLNENALAGGNNNLSAKPDAKHSVLQINLQRDQYHGIQHHAGSARAGQSHAELLRRG